MSTDALREALAKLREKRHLCPDCKGTGADAAKTAKARRTGACDSRSYIRCWTCSGNGLNPEAYFRFVTASY